MNIKVLPCLLAVFGLFAAEDGFAQSDSRAGYPDRGQVIRCESKDGRTQVCQADVRGDVRLVRQISDTACVQGQNWGADRRGLWVGGGCRGDFEIGSRGRGRDRDEDDRFSGDRYGRDGAQTLRCESRDKRQQYCDADTRGGVRLLRQVSGSNCVEGRTWGYDRRGVWVSGGCRGEFQIGGSRGRPGGWTGGDGGTSARSMRCESGDNRYRSCPAGDIRRAQLVRKLSDSACEFNVSWGYDRQQVWVDRGCRGEFAVY